MDCATCKTPRNRHKAPRLPLPKAGPFDRLAVDCLEPFPTSHRENRHIVIFSDYLTKWPKVFAVPDTVAKTNVRLLVDEITAQHGAPRFLLSDHGRN